MKAAETSSGPRPATTAPGGGTQRPSPEALCGLHVLADDDPRWPIGPVEQARAACDGGAAVVQLRAKLSRDVDVLAMAREIRAITKEAGTLFILNDRFDLALLADADGVHLGQGDLPPSRIPETARKRLAIGRSTHDVAQLRAAAGEPIDYVAFGPVFGTTSKESSYARRGTDALAAAVREAANRPLIAIGGIGRDNLAAVLEAGARGAAVISAVAAVANPAEATRELVRLFDRAEASGGNPE